MVDEARKSTRTTAVVEKALWTLSTLVVLATLISVVVFTFGTIATRVPYWGEAEVLFEASRLAHGYPLFVDPLVGATEYGLPPSRFYVTYPPLLSAAMSLVPEAPRLIVGRVLATLAWFGSLAWVVRSGGATLRRNAIVCAAFVLGIWVLANFATTGRPDSFACACAAIGLNRAVLKKKIDPISIVLLILAVWLKPTLLGLPAGAFVADAIVRRQTRALLLAAAIAAVSFLLLHWLTHGQLFVHIVRSNAQPFSFDIWIERITHHLPFFGPLFLVAIVHGWRSRRTDPGIAIGFGAMIGALGWVLCAIAKTGSSANYWMEPCVAAIVLLAHAEGPFVFGKSGLLHAALALATVLYADTAAISGSFRQMNQYRREAAFVATAKSRCNAEMSSSDVIASDEQGLELAMNGRILTPAYQMSWLVREGKFPASVYIADVTAPQVKCFLVHSNAIASPEARQAIDEHFRPLVTEGDMKLLTAAPR